MPKIYSIAGTETDDCPFLYFTTRGLAEQALAQYHSDANIIEEIDVLDEIPDWFRIYHTITSVISIDLLQVVHHNNNSFLMIPKEEHDKNVEYVVTLLNRERREYTINAAGVVYEDVMSAIDQVIFAIGVCIGSGEEYPADHIVDRDASGKRVSFRKGEPGYEVRQATG